MASLVRTCEFFSVKDLQGHEPLTFSGLSGAGIWSQWLSFFTVDFERW